MTIKLLETTTVGLSEKEIQQAFEKRLDLIEPGLQHIGSFVAVGSGIIDSLCIDSENYAVIIEFKKPGDFDRDALIQLMNYYSWFERDPNHMTLLNETIRSKKPGFEEVEDIRLIAVVSNVEENVMNACYALKPSTQLVTYSIVKEGNGDFGIVPSVILDTEEREPMVRKPKTEEDHMNNLEGYENLREIYVEIKTIVTKIAPDSLNAAPKGYIAFAGKRNFASVKFQKYPKPLVRLELFLRDSATGDSRLKPMQYAGWYSINIESKDQVDEQMRRWIESAFKEQSR